MVTVISLVGCLLIGTALAGLGVILVMVAAESIVEGLSRSLKGVSLDRVFSRVTSFRFNSLL